MYLNLKTCVLRNWKKSDKESLLYHANNFNVWINLRDGFPYPYTNEKADEFLDWVTMADSKRSEIICAIEVDGKAIGGAGLHPQSDVERYNVEIGLWLGEEYWHKGIGTDVIKQLTTYAFNTLKFKRVFATVFEENVASFKMLLKAGYIERAYLPCSIYKNDRFTGSYLLDKINEDV